MIRLEAPRDQEAVRRVHDAAFSGPTEAALVEALHREGAAVVALVAELDGQVVGHVLFSPVSVEPTTTKRLLGLGPMAVAPRIQRRGIGTLLVREGLERCRVVDGAQTIVVLGHAEYYPRFGFRPAHGFGLRCEYNVPSDLFMAVELVPNSLRQASGLVHYHKAFSEV